MSHKPYIRIGTVIQPHPVGDRIYGVYEEKAGHILLSYEGRWLFDGQFVKASSEERAYKWFPTAGLDIRITKRRKS